MLQVMRKLLIVVLVGLLVSSCANKGTSEGIGGGVGAVIGGLLGNEVANGLGIGGTGRNILIAAGAGLGAVAGVKIGGELSKYFGENDQKNLKTLLDDDKPQRAAWCSDKEGKPSGYTTPTRNVKAVQCSSGSKITQSLGASKRVKTSEGEQVCKTSKTEVSNSGNPETISTTMCKKSDGTWYEKTA